MVSGRMQEMGLGCLPFPSGVSTERGQINGPMRLLALSGWEPALDGPDPWGQKAVIIGRTFGRRRRCTVCITFRGLRTFKNLAFLLRELLLLLIPIFYEGDL